MAKRSVNEEQLRAAIQRKLDADIKKVQDEMDKARKNALRQIGQYGVTKLRELIRDYCYTATIGSQWYDRLGENGGLLDTISYRTHGDSVELYCDWTKLDRLTTSQVDYPNKYPAHASITNGKKFTEGIWEYYVEGKIHYIYEAGHPEHQVHQDFTKDLMRMLNNELKQYADDYIIKHTQQIFGNKLGKMYTQNAASIKHGRHSHR